MENNFDVIIYNIASGEVDTFAGKDMPLKTGSFHTAEKRLMTALQRLNSRYSAAIVPTGKYQVGDKVNDIYEP